MFKVTNFKKKSPTFLKKVTNLLIIKNVGFRDFLYDSKVYKGLRLTFSVEFRIFAGFLASVA